MNHLKNEDKKFLQLAYQEALLGLKEGGIPIGAVLVVDNKVVAKGRNKRIQEHSMIKHAEMDCLENTKARILPEQMQRATLSPCYMCAGAVLLNQIPRLVIGENQTFEQSESLLRVKEIEMHVVNDTQCIQMMLTFIQKNPKLWGEDIGLTEQQILTKYPSDFAT